MACLKFEVSDRITANEQGLLFVPVFRDRPVRNRSPDLIEDEVKFF
jgi:hypothetical protein